MRLLVSLFLCVSAGAQFFPFPGPGNPEVAAPSYLWHETFEGTAACGWGGYTNCDTTPFFGGGAVANYVTAPAPLQGTKSLLTTSATDQLVQTVTPSNELYAAVEFNFSALPSADVEVMSVEDASGNDLCVVTTFSTNQIIGHNTGGSNATASPAPSFATGTTYYAKIRVKAGTGANAECQVFYSTNGSTWFSGTTTNGTWTAQAARVRIFGPTGTQNDIFDDIRVSTSDINYP